jgi:hypothetical protein
MTTPAPHGHFCWPELATRDLAQAKAFYGGLFDWEANDIPSAEGTYTVFQHRGLPVAAAYQMGPHQTTAPRWNSYVQVASADEAHAQALALGATSLAAPFDIPDVGRMGHIQDPQGAPLALWQAGQHAGALVFGEPGSLCWTELATPDPARAEAFYTALFGWRAEHRSDVGMDYTEFWQGEVPVGGMYERPDHAAHWVPYFAAGDPDALATRAQAEGGTVGLDPQDIPSVGRFALLHDAGGAAFAVIRLD